MAFHKIEKLRTGGNGPREAEVTMGAYLADGKVHKSKSIAFRITKPLIEQLGWKFEDRVVHLNVNEGTDVDKGFIQIAPDPAGRRTTMGAGKNQGLAISIAAASFKHYVLNESPVPSRVVPHMVDGDALIIECPDWLRYNEASVPKPAPAPVTELHTRRGPGRPRRHQG